MKYTKIELNQMDPVELYKLILSGQITRFPNNYWKNKNAKQNAKKITKYFIIDILKCDEVTILDKISLEIVTQYKLSGMMNQIYTTLQNMVSDVFPNFNIKDKWKTNKFKKNHSEKIKNLSKEKWDNIKYGIKHNRYTNKYGAKLSASQRGENNNQHKLTEKDIPIIRQLLNEGYSAQEIGNMFGVARTTISDIKHFRSWNFIE